MRESWQMRHNETPSSNLEAAGDGIDKMSLSREKALESLNALIDRFQGLSVEDTESASESDTLVYVDDLFGGVLGWPTGDIKKYQREKPVVNRKRVDRILNLDNGQSIYIEAKRFGSMDTLSEDWTLGPQQMSLPGMATDRTQDEQQAINYAFENDGAWAILTDFKTLRLYNARRDWLVFAFTSPRAYEREFELLWQLSWDNLRQGSLDALNNQRWTRDVDTDYLEFINHQREQLAIDIALNPDLNPWAFNDDGSLRVDGIRAVVQRVLDRLVVIRFAEDHFVIAPGTLRGFADLRRNSPTYTQSLQHYLRDFFVFFDQQHNSALFARAEADEARFSDAALLPLIDKLYEARFRAMPADIIGNTYEQFLGKTLVADNGSIKTADNLETRKKQGSYYTPQSIVRFIVDQTLGRYLYATRDGRPKGIRFYSQEPKTSMEIRNLRILDSACGSGSFLIYIYQVLAEFYESEIVRLEAETQRIYKELAQEFFDNGVTAKIEVRQIENELLFVRENYRDMILERHIYGVDLDPQAAEIAVVNLMMRALERKSKNARLPLLLNQNIKVGNSLIGLMPDDPRLAEYAGALATLRRLREELLNTPNVAPRHAEILEQIETTKTGLYSNFETDFTSRQIDPAKLRAFHWAIEFPEAYVDEDGKLLEDGGFDFIVGNPPYGAKLGKEEQTYFRRVFELGTTNTAPLFMMQSLNLLSAAGVHGYIVPKSFLYASNWKKPRERLLQGLDTLADCGKAFEAVELEQVIYVHQRNQGSSFYRNMKLKDGAFTPLASIKKKECDLFGFYINDMTDADLDVAHHLLESGNRLGNHIANTRGAALQQFMDLRSGSRVIGGANVQRHHLQDQRGFCGLHTVPPNAVVTPGNVLVQNIVTRLQHPVEYIRIVAHLAQPTDADCLILDTVNQIAVSSEDLTGAFVLALLNSKLLNWYIYRFIYAKAVMTMHFDNPVTNRIPLPDLDAQPELVAKIVAEVDKIYANRHANEKTSQERIDQYIYQLYGLSQDQIDLVEANMP